MEETLEFQEEYPREEAEEVEEVAEEVEEVEEEVSLRPYQHNKQLPMEETNLLGIHPLYSQEIAPHRKHS